MKGVRRFKDRLKEDLKNPKFRRAFDREEIFVSVAVQIAKIRQKQGLSQKELARRLNTTQQTISRLENTNNRSCSLNTLVRLAKILHKKVKIDFL